MSPSWAERSRHTHAACARFLDRLLLEPEELLEALAPEGWERSPLHRTFHPTPEQLAEEEERFRTNLEALRGASGSADRAEPPPEDDDDPAAAAPPRTIEPEQEVVELLGHALWDVFSDNHTVVDSDGVAYDLGSFRGSADFIAESINRRYTHLRRSYHYLDFYMGSLMYSGRADLRPVYRWIFTLLREEGCHWIYSFPRTYLIDFSSGPAEASQDDFSSYDPSDAVRSEVERGERDKEVRELAEKLERAQEGDLRKARDRPLPATVAAYRDVFGSLPEGWPHPDM